MTYSEDDLLPISALQHLLFCERQCALIHVELEWAENRLTAEGSILHERVHEQGGESRGDVRIARGVRLRSLRLGLTGVADVVEFRRDEGGVEVPGMPGRRLPTPVEYKRGRPKPDVCDDVQLCAQAMCLEEMLNCTIHEGFLFYGTPRRRHHVLIDAVLRDATERAVHRLHELVDGGVTPPPVYEKKCKACSLFAQCMPKTAGGRKSAKMYLKSQVPDLQP
ncbi:MAG: CRISPR-associated protein Cas4 [bacterium]